MSNSYLDQAALCKTRHIISTTANDKMEADKLVGFSNVIVRDARSVEIMKSKGAHPNLYPDLAFALRPDRERGAALIRQHFAEQKRDLYDKVVVVVVNGYLADPEASAYDVRRFLNFQKFSYDLARLADWTHASFLFLPFGHRLPWDDRVTNLWALQKSKFWKKNLSVWSEPSVQSVLDMVGACDAVISTRLHSTIFAVACETPFIDVTHNHKNAWQLETIGASDWSVPYTSFDEAVVRPRLKDMLDSGREFKKRVSSLLDRQKPLLENLGKIRLV